MMRPRRSGTLATAPHEVKTGHHPPRDPFGTDSTPYNYTTVVTWLRDGKKTAQLLQRDVSTTYHQHNFLILQAVAQIQRGRQ